MKRVSSFDQLVRDFTKEGKLMQLGLSQVGWKLRFSTFSESCHKKNQSIDKRFRLTEQELSVAIDNAWELIQSS